MGGCGSKATNFVGEGQILVSAQQKSNDSNIEKKMLKQLEDEKKIINCLILGAGECGKSTILKQMKILHKNGFNDVEKKEYRQLIRSNTVEAIQTLIEAVRTLDGLKLDGPENEQRADALLKALAGGSSMLPLEWRDDIAELWKDGGIRKAVERQNEFHFLDSGAYFLDKVQTTFQPDYMPDHGDILRSRQATEGILQTDFTLDKLHFRMYDVGGQRGERRKWIHCFHGVTAIMYIASLSEYDQVLAEDRTRNRFLESLDLFEGIINLPWFKDAPIILFLNKYDVFEEKIKRVDIGNYFEEYKGGCDLENGRKWIEDQYFLRNRNKYKTIYCHTTNATDTDIMTSVWRCTKHIILEQNLKRSGLLMTRE